MDYTVIGCSPDKGTGMLHQAALHIPSITDASDPCWKEHRATTAASAPIVSEWFATASPKVDIVLRLLALVIGAIPASWTYLFNKDGR